MQISRAIWEDFFFETEGWTWEQVVMDDAINFRAAYIIYQRAGYTYAPWPNC